MTTNSILPRSVSFGRKILLLAGLGLLLKFQPVAMAASIYTYALDTSTLSGQTGQLAFDSIGGDFTPNNNTVTVSDFSSDGSLVLSSVVLTDTGFFNEELRNIVFGSFLNFTVTLTGNFDGSGAFDQFSFFLLDDTGMFSLVTTDDPTGALFAVDIDGNAGGIASPFTTLGNLASGTAQVPDAGGTLSLVLLSLGSAGVYGLVRKFLPKSTQA